MNAVIQFENGEFRVVRGVRWISNYPRDFHGEVAELIIYFQDDKTSPEYIKMADVFSYSVGDIS